MWEKKNNVQYLSEIKLLDFCHLDSSKHNNKSLNIL